MWVLLTIAAAALQTIRNLSQRRLTEAAGAWGASWARFLFGLPFAVFLAVGAGFWGGVDAPPRLFWFWALLGAVSQIIGTAALLKTMQARGVGVGVALSKLELVLIALGAALWLADPLTPILAAAVALAAAGSALASWRPGGASLAAVGWGLTTGLGFAVATVAFKGAILILPAAQGPAAAVICLAIVLAMQTALLGVWLAWRRPQACRAVLASGRVGWLAGAAGAFASALWFVSFALAPAAAVRAVGLVELPFAWIAAWRLMGERPNRRGLAGCGLLAGAVGLILWGG